MFFGQDQNKKRKGGRVFQTRQVFPSFFILKFRHSDQRTSSAASARKGSMTIEAALALPLFLLASLMLLSMIDMMRTYVRGEEKLFEQTRQAAVYAGKAGQGVGGTDYVEFYIPCRAAPKVKGLGYRSFLLVNHCKAHVWNGYGGTSPSSQTEEAEYVYITESGTAYHKRRSCSHLNITIREVSKGQLGGERNEDGSRYRPCPYCTRGARKDTGAQYYVTSYGNKYHTSLVCSGLKRTILVVRKEQAAGRYPCSECGG